MDGYIPCNLPFDWPTALPLSLLHPAFGAAETYVPTSDDAKFLLAFEKAMMDIYGVEDDRKNACLKVFDDHRIPIKPTTIGRFTTDGDLYWIFDRGIQE